MKIKIIEHIPKGIENAVTQADLATLLQISERQVRSLINEARRHGAVICSTCDGMTGGYYLPNAPDEVKPYLRMQESRIRSAAEAIKSCEEYMEKHGN